jgi:hypothetical protein
VNDATPPSTGPNSAPPIANPSAVPISPPRRAGGAAATSQASPPVHENALERPWRNRARSTCHSSPATPNAALVAARPQSPATTVGFGPSRAATIPLGIAPTSAPAGYAAWSTPQPVFPIPSDST